MQRDHLFSTKPAEVCIYYINMLLLPFLDIQYLSESIHFELKIGNKVCNFVVLYRSPNQPQYGLENFYQES